MFFLKGMEHQLICIADHNINDPIGKITTLSNFGMAPQYR